MTNIQIQLSKLNSRETLQLAPEGNSMYPFATGNRDLIYVVPFDGNLKRGDMALYLRDNGRYVVHRVHHVKKDANGTTYYMVGDHQTEIEGPLYPASIHGKIVAINRKGKHINCLKNRKYIFLSKLWLIVRPVRPLFFKLDNIRYRHLVKNH